VPSTSTPTIGVLAMQGDVREHLAALERLGVRAVGVRRPAELAAVDALVFPGGESTTMDKLLRAFDLFEPLRDRLAAGMPAYGSCAGMILLAERILDGTSDQQALGALDVTVRRNAFGRQVDSFEEDIVAPALGAGPEDRPMRAVFIRAPWVEDAGPGVEVLARVSTGPAAGRIVAVREGAVMATAFHPELGADPRVHAAFVRMVRDRVSSER
jgi:5'-phosphate synthase pdxT subunit